MYSAGRDRIEYRCGTGVAERGTVYVAQLQEYRSMVNRLNRENQYLSNNVIDLIKENTLLKTKMHEKRIYEVKEIDDPRQIKRVQKPSKVTQKPSILGKGFMREDGARQSNKKKLEEIDVYVVQNTQKRFVDNQSYKSPTMIQQLSERRFASSKKKGIEVMTKQSSNRVVSFDNKGSKNKIRRVQTMQHATTGQQAQEEKLKNCKTDTAQKQINDIKATEVIRNDQSIANQLGMQDQQLNSNIKAEQSIQKYRINPEILKKQMYNTSLRAKQVKRQQQKYQIMPKKSNSPYKTSLNSNPSNKFSNQPSPYIYQSQRKNNRPYLESHYVESPIRTYNSVLYKH